MNINNDFIRMQKNAGLLNEKNFGYNVASALFPGATDVYDVGKLSSLYKTLFQLIEQYKPKSKTIKAIDNQLESTTHARENMKTALEVNDTKKITEIMEKYVVRFWNSINMPQNKKKIEEELTAALNKNQPKQQQVTPQQLKIQPQSQQQQPQSQPQPKSQETSDGKQKIGYNNSNIQQQNK